MIDDKKELSCNNEKYQKIINEIDKLNKEKKNLEEKIAEEKKKFDENKNKSYHVINEFNIKMIKMNELGLNLNNEIKECDIRIIKVSEIIEMQKNKLEKFKLFNELLDKIIFESNKIINEN